MKRQRRWNLAVGVGLWLLSLGVGCPLALTADTRPNFLIILSDDQRYDTLNEHMRTYMPFTYDFFSGYGPLFNAAGGVWFDRGYDTTPFCCPSRSSILTGMYAHHHGVRQNVDKLTQKTLPQWLKENGYFTGIVGKYLNSWNLFTTTDPPPPGFDDWVVIPDGYIANYFDYTLYDNGVKLEHLTTYATHNLRDYALRFLDRAAVQGKPFFLFFTPNAPHFPAQPAPEDTLLTFDESWPASMNESDVSDKPDWLKTWASRGHLTKTEIVDINNLRLNQRQSLKALDRAVNAIISKLKAQGQLNNTVVIYLSDNGYFWGEHRLEGKLRVYEEATRVPFALRYPSLVPSERVESKLAANIDIAPTLYELAGIPIPAGVDGRSLVPLLKGTSTWRTALLLEGWPILWNEGPLSPPWSAVHTGGSVYVETEGDRSEFYDLAVDPLQQLNRASDPAYAAEIKRLQDLLHAMQPFQLVSLTDSPDPFSPNSDKQKDTTTISGTFNRTLTSGKLHIFNSANTLVRSFGWGGSTTHLTQSWDGTYDGGGRVPDGTYSYTLIGFDAQGNQAQRSGTVTVDTTAPTFNSVTISPNPFKPSAGQPTTIAFSLSEAATVTVQIYNSAGTLVRTLLSNSLVNANVTQNLVWDGKTPSGSLVAPGTYTARLWVIDLAGNKALTYPLYRTITVQ